MPLPAPAPIKDAGRDVRLPAAWLVVGDGAVAGSRGHFTYEGEAPCEGNSQETPPAGSRCVGVVYAEAGPPDAAPHADFPAVAIPAAMRPVIVVSSTSVRQLDATLRDWAEEGVPPVDRSWRVHPHTRVRRTDSLTIYAFSPIGKGPDRVLTVTIKLKGATEVTYYWRLQPK